MTIIDAHSHLGDILYRGGGALIDKVGVTKKAVFDPAGISERSLHFDPLGLGRFTYALLSKALTRAERERNFTATYENFRRSMDEVGITHSVALPVPPYLNFEDLAPVADKDTGVIAFTGVDYTEGVDSVAKLHADVNAGARGLKLHPIIQKIPLTSEETMSAVEAFSTYDLPVLLHCGVSSYYLGSEREKQEPSYGEIRYAAELIKAFPDVRFIAGHSGLFDVRDVMRLFAGLANVWVETSFQSVALVRKLLGVFGPDRVVFGSDWPFGNRPPALAIARATCKGDPGLQRRMLCDNAAELLGMTV